MSKIEYLIWQRDTSLHLTSPNRKLSAAVEDIDDLSKSLIFGVNNIDIASISTKAISTHHYRR